MRDGLNAPVAYDLERYHIIERFAGERTKDRHSIGNTIKLQILSGSAKENAWIQPEKL